MITVGAVDVNGSANTADDVSAPWSAYGYTPDGFAKPEIGAPGRYLIEQVPPQATLLTDFPGNVLDTAQGLLQLSGTSFAAAAVSGMAANLLGVHPTWTPDQVKGELMRSAVELAAAEPGSLGRGGGQPLPGDQGAGLLLRSAESECCAGGVPRPRPFGRHVARVRREAVDRRRLRRPELEHGFVVVRLVVERLVELGVVVERFLELGVVVERFLDFGVVVERLVELGLVVERGGPRRQRRRVDGHRPGRDASG